MSDLSKIRTLIGDQVQYGTSESVQDGSVLDFLLPYAPLVTATTKVYVNAALKTVDVDYTIDEQLGLVTFLTGPVGTVVITAKYHMLSDDEINEMLELNEDSIHPVRSAAADCLDIIASSETLIQKKLSLLDMNTDGPAIAKSLREHAKSLRDQVKALADDDTGSFEIIEMVYDEPTFVEQLFKGQIREDD